MQIFAVLDLADRRESSWRALARDLRIDTMIKKTIVDTVHNGVHAGTDSGKVFSQGFCVIFGVRRYEVGHLIETTKEFFFAVKQAIIG